MTDREDSMHPGVEQLEQELRTTGEVHIGISNRRIVGIALLIWVSGLIGGGIAEYQNPGDPMPMLIGLVVWTGIVAVFGWWLSWMSRKNIFTVTDEGWRSAEGKTIPWSGIMRATTWNSGSYLVPVLHLTDDAWRAYSAGSTRTGRAVSSVNNRVLQGNSVLVSATNDDRARAIVAWVNQRVGDRANR